MELELLLIRLYLRVCGVYDKHPMLKYQRWSNNTTEPLFTDQTGHGLSLWLAPKALSAASHPHLSAAALERVVSAPAQLSGLQSSPQSAGRNLAGAVGR